MARRYYGGLNSAGGFADGFSSGFGLINDAVDSRKRRELDEQKLAADERAAQSEREFREQQAGWRQDDKVWQREQAASAKKFQNEERIANNRTRDASIAASNAQTDLANKKFETAQYKLDQEKRTDKAIASLASLEDLLKYSRENGISPDLDVVQQLVNDTKGTVFDAALLVGTDYGKSLADLTSTLREQLNSGEIDFTDPRILGGFDAMVNSYQGGLIGQFIDDSFVNAPEEIRNGTWKVISREATGMKVDEAGNFSSDVLVTAQDPRTRDIVHYIAPLTAKRGQGSKDRIQVPVKQMMDGIAGTTVLIDRISGDMKSIIKRAAIEKEGGHADFRAKVDTRVEALRNQKAANETRRDILPTKLNRDVTEEDILRVAEDQVLGIGSKNKSHRAEAKAEILQTRKDIEEELKNYKSLDERGDITTSAPAPELTDQQILRISPTLSPKGAVTKLTRDRLREIMENENGAKYIKRSSSAYGSAVLNRYGGLPKN